MKKWNRRMLRKLTALLLIACMLPVFALAEEEIPENDGSWVTFFLVCNEGMINSGGNSGNTMMLVAMNPGTGKIRLMMITWDTFVEYEGYDVPQKIDMPYRNNGPEETMKVFNDNFGIGVDLFMSLNYLNLANMIDSYGGVDVDITRAERNALNGMVASKAENIQAQAASGLLSQMVVEMLAKDYYLSDYGPDTHLNGLQAVGFGWLQYDSVYNCCERDAEVISKLFKSVSDTISEKVLFYTNETDYPEGVSGQRVINLDELTEDDITFLRQQVEPIFDMAYNNLTEDDIVGIGTTLARAAYMASRQGLDVFDNVEYTIFPLEAKEEYDIVGGAKGHLADTEANRKAMQKFLFSTGD